jgi:diguanylate cyclase (GGDEF)-like protein
LPLSTGGERLCFDIMEMLATARSLHTAQPTPSICVTEADVDQLSRRNFLDHIPLSNVTNVVPFTLIALCCSYVAQGTLLAALLALNIAAVFGMHLISRRLRKASSLAQSAFWWRVYELAAFASGVLWAATMLPVIATLGHDIASMFVCVIIIVSVAVTSMVVASQRRTVLSFLAGVMLCLIPQTAAYLAVIGPIPLVATIGLGPALVGLAHAIRKQERLMIRTQLENQQLAESLTEALAVAKLLASRDSLTGIYNRRAFEELASGISGDEPDTPLSLILLDLDHFKSINDRHGHGIGDSVLKETAQLIETTVGPFGVVGRGDGAVARWGGEEFILLLRGATLEQAAHLAETLRQGLAALCHPQWPEGLVVTGSLGVARWHEGMPLHLGIGLADTAMYQAKKAGRNQVSLSGEAPDVETAVMA